ncbi:hypothetical protein EDD18DRAFT_1354058 [Armillaria luteobubalina]|uniref:Uncharacterized protein n=1 Tax=Armillaria luteobubalina TaxID=153913 RepID=A0AA39Q3J4_9AGAR|nr:hypothetical protein EDD18DRAFT_1354058 [Armillaria luteobubalina]
MSPRKGQYVDGHEREDVVKYWREVFLPAMAALESRMRKWSSNDGPETVPDSHTRCVVVWFHDESTFYANDCRQKTWEHKNGKARLRAKGDGSSLMIAEFVSADHGFLCSPDGTESARVVFRAGKGSGRDGYFTNEEIRKQAEKAMDILAKYFPDEDHILVFDNATTHVKHAGTALSATRMPKGPPATFGVDVPIVGDDGKQKKGLDENLLKERIHMANGRFSDGTDQEFYYPDDHPALPGYFKGMATILEERGFENAGSLKAQCKKTFSECAQQDNCCCRRILFNQPDFVDVESILETDAKA